MWMMTRLSKYYGSNTRLPVVAVLPFLFTKTHPINNSTTDTTSIVVVVVVYKFHVKHELPVRRHLPVPLSSVHASIIETQGSPSNQRQQL